MSGQRERLLARPRPSIAYQLLVDPDTVDAARAALAQAQADARQVALAKPASAARRRAERAVADAEAAVEACYETIVLRALPTAGEVTTEILIAAHPPTAEQMAAVRVAREQATARGEKTLPAWPDWDDDTFRPALLAACCENGMNADDWSAFLASHVSEGEKRGLWMACLAINERERVADPLVLPKGLMAMLSSTLS